MEGLNRYFKMTSEEIFLENYPDIALLYSQDI